MASQGWIKLHRQILECSIWVGFDDEPEEPFDKRSAWIDLLLRANHSDKEFVFNYNPIIVGRGQLITSVRKLSARWGWSVKKTYNYLNLLLDLGMITKESDNSKTLLTIVNYGVYQDIGNTQETLDATEGKQGGNTRETRNAHKQECKELKNVKNEKNERNNIICSEPFTSSEPPFIELILNDGSLYPISVEMVSEFKELYPSVDVEQELRKMKGWCNTNPTKRKTKRGILRFVNSWLAKEQDKGGSDNQPRPSAYMDSIRNRVNVVDSWV